MSIGDPLLIEVIDAMLQRTCGPAAVEAAEREGWHPVAWDNLVETGLDLVGVPESAGGSGGSLVDALALVRRVGAHAAPLPLAETAVLGSWLLAGAGLDIGRSPVGVVPPSADLAVTDGWVRGSATVAWGRQCQRIAVLVEDAGSPLVVSLPRELVAVTPGVNIAGEPRDRVSVDVPLESVQAGRPTEDITPDELARRGTLTRIVLTAGALASMVSLTVEYTRVREQFGRPVAGFQAVQHLVVALAEASARASVAADCAVLAIGTDRFPLAVAAARIVVDRAAVEGSRTAHQAHGAIGVSREYRLQQLTRRLWSWRHEYGSARAYRQELGSAVTAAGADHLFAVIAGQPE